MPNLPPVPDLRVATANTRPPRRDGDYVLYWMTGNRRASRNFALERALEWCVRLDRPLVVLEGLRAGYRWASDRHHRFVLDGMRANARAFAGSGARYVPYVEPEPGAGRGLIEAASQRACVVVADDVPAFFLPRMVRAAAAKLGVLLETVDSNGILPLAATSESFPTAYAFRRFLQRTLSAHLPHAPRERPFEDLDLPAAVDLAPAVRRRWPEADEELLAGTPAALARLPIDHTVAPVEREGGSERAGIEVVDFVRRRLARYAEERSEPTSDASSGLSPWLHFGHVSVHAVLAEVARAEGWTPARVARTASGKKEGWWNMGASAEAFLDELVTWRELGFVFARHHEETETWESLPAWARATLEEHARDPRPHLYTLEEFAAARTHDALWNAAQRELLREGRIHNYLRMLWGKKILEWTRTPQDALAVMIELNHRYALDGRDPNSSSGIAWVLGRYDRPWGPVRKVFGTIRYMTSENTARKLDVRPYLARHAP